MACHLIESTTMVTMNQIIAAGHQAPHRWLNRRPHYVSIVVFSKPLKPANNFLLHFTGLLFTLIGYPQHPHLPHRLGRLLQPLLNRDHPAWSAPSISISASTSSSGRISPRWKISKQGLVSDIAPWRPHTHSIGRPDCRQVFAGRKSRLTATLGASMPTKAAAISIRILKRVF